MKQLGLKPFMYQQAKHYVPKYLGKPWFHEFSGQGNKRGERRASKIRLRKYLDEE